MDPFTAPAAIGITSSTAALFQTAVAVVRRVRRQSFADTVTRAIVRTLRDQSTEITRRTGAISVASDRRAVHRIVQTSPAIAAGNLAGFSAEIPTLARQLMESGAIGLAGSPRSDADIQDVLVVALREAATHVWTVVKTDAALQVEVAKAAGPGLALRSALHEALGEQARVIEDAIYAALRPIAATIAATWDTAQHTDATVSAIQTGQDQLAADIRALLARAPRDVGHHESEPIYWAGRPASIGTSFVGHQEVMADLTRGFATQASVVLAGGAGIGKTRIAAEFAHASGSPGFWTTASTNPEQTLVTLAPSLGIPTDGRTVDDVAAAVQLRLGRLPAGTLWVIDSLPSIDLANALANASGGLHVLITSRDARRHLLGPAVGFIPVEVPKLEAAVALLGSRRERVADKSVLRDIADEVGRLPLALEVLAARLAAPMVSPEGVLARLRDAQNPLELDEFRRAAATAIPRAESLYATLRLALESLAPATRAGLAVLGYVADAPLPLGLVTKLTGIEGEALGDAIEEYQRESLVGFVGRQIYVHPLVAAAIAATNASGSLAVAMPSFKERLDAAGTDQPVALRAEMPHFERILALAKSEFGIEAGATLAFANSLAVGYGAAGRTADAIRLHEETLDVRTRALGPKHGDTLQSRNNLAVGYSAAGRTADAIRLHEKTLDLRSRVLGQEHPDTLKSRGNLASAYRAVGRDTDAEDL